MALFDEDYDVRMAEGYVREAENLVASRKANRDAAKRCGNYRNSPKNIRLSNGSMGNGYDSNVAIAEDLLKRRKAELAKAKEKAKEAKKRKQEEAKREAARQKELKAKEGGKSQAAAKSSSSKSSSSSSSSSSSPSYSGGLSSRSEDRRTAAEAAAAAAAAVELKRKVDREVSSYMSTIRSKYNINDASEKTLTLYIMELTLEEERLEKERVAARNDELRRRVASECKSGVANYKTIAWNRCKKIMLDDYVKSLESKYPVRNNSAAYIAKCLPSLLQEIEEQRDECKKYASDRNCSSLYYSQERAAREYATEACLRLKKLDVGLFNKPEVQRVVKKIDPELESTMLKRVVDTLLAPYYWVEEKVRVASKCVTDKRNAVSKWIGDKKGAVTTWVGDKKNAVCNWASNKMDLLKSKLKKR